MIYTEENIFVRTSTQKGNILIEIDTGGKDLLTRNIFLKSKYSEERQMEENTILTVKESESQLKCIYKNKYNERIQMI